MSHPILASHHFTRFLIKAKQETYAGDGHLTTPSRTAAKDLRYKEGEFVYLDSYLGDIDFIGEEAVWYQDEPVWGMNYFGRMLTKDIPAGFSKALKGALLRVLEEMPYRGPEEFVDGDFRYTCSVEGELDWFRGKEYIFYKGERIYQLYFHGGAIKKKG